ncbi:MAG: hypothetical protein CMJ48_12890, partial [Planctomycetaceae bacterium]|nr:hypothetical protein [Planctomycetaceae bacterium]
RRHRVGLAPWWTVPMVMAERGVPRLSELELRESENAVLHRLSEPCLVAAEGRARTKDHRIVEYGQPRLRTSGIQRRDAQNA